jgi:hypothetical protein
MILSEKSATFPDHALADSLRESGKVGRNRLLRRCGRGQRTLPMGLVKTAQ